MQPFVINASYELHHCNNKSIQKHAFERNKIVDVFTGFIGKWESFSIKEKCEVCIDVPYLFINLFFIEHKMFSFQKCVKVPAQGGHGYEDGGGLVEVDGKVVWGVGGVRGVYNLDEEKAMWVRVADGGEKGATLAVWGEKSKMVCVCVCVCVCAGDISLVLKIYVVLSVECS